MCPEKSGEDRHEKRLERAGRLSRWSADLEARAHIATGRAEAVHEEFERIIEMISSSSS